MSKGIVRLLTAFGVAAAAAQGAVQVEFSGNNGQSFQDLTNDPDVSIDIDNNVTIANANAGIWRISVTDPASEDLGQITFTNSNASLDLLISTTATNINPNGQVAPGCRDWGGLVLTGADVRLQASMTSDLVGSASAVHIVRIDADGAILANVTQDPSDGNAPELRAVRAESGNITGNVRAYAGDIRDVLALVGSISGGIQADEGAIELVSAAGNVSQAIQALGGDVGTVDVGGNLTGNVTASDGIGSILVGGNVGVLGGAAVTISCDDDIEEIVVDGDMHATITTSPANGTGNLRKLRVLGVGAAEGDFAGSLTVKDVAAGVGVIDPGVYAAGDISAAMTFTSALAEPLAVDGSVSGDITIGNKIYPEGSIDVAGDIDGTIAVTNGVEGPISVTGALAGNILIGDALDDDVTLGAGGLEGSIDADDDGIGSWSGDVIVGSYTLGTGQSPPDQAPMYGRTIAQLGGGAIGVVADWGFHPTDTYPADGVVIGQPQFMSDSTVRIFHYGPIDDTLHEVLQIETRPIGIGSFTDVTNDFDFSFDSGSTRELKIDSKAGEEWMEGNEYRITHEAGDLKIAPDVLLSGSVDVAPYVYEFQFN